MCLALVECYIAWEKSGANLDSWVSDDNLTILEHIFFNKIEHKLETCTERAILLSSPRSKRKSENLLAKSFHLENKIESIPIKSRF